MEQAVIEAHTKEIQGTQHLETAEQDRRNQPCYLKRNPQPRLEWLGYVAQMLINLVATLGLHNRFYNIFFVKKLVSFKQVPYQLISYCKL